MCALGNRQIEGVDYFKHHVYSPVINSREIHVSLSLAAANDWNIHQSDITQGFTYGSLDEQIFLQPPPGYPCPPGHVLLCQRSIYGLRQAPAKFHERLVKYFDSRGYVPVNDAKTAFFKRRSSSFLLHDLYVDDTLHFDNDPAMYQEFREDYAKEFDVKPDDTLGMFVGSRIKHDKKQQCITVDQEHYARTIIENYGFQDLHPARTPMTAEKLSAKDQPPVVVEKVRNWYQTVVGSFNFLAAWTRPEILHACSELSKFMSNPGPPHVEAVKRLGCYVKGTLALGLTYRNVSDPDHPPNQLWGYVDADWAGNLDNRRSTLGYVLMLNGCAVSWKSKRQSLVALSTAEAEFIAASSLVQEVIYLRRFLLSLGFPQNGPTLIYEDNESCIAWAEGAVVGAERAKHIELRKYFVHDAVAGKVLKLVPISSKLNSGDIFTKSAIHFDDWQVHRKRVLGL